MLGTSASALAARRRVARHASLSRDACAGAYARRPAARVDLGEREALLQGQPDAFFTTPHYDGHPSVLVRLEVVDAQELAELLEEAWRLRAPKRAHRRSTTPRR